MTSFYNQQRPTLVEGRLALISNGGSIEGLGVRTARAGIRQIEASTRPLAPSTRERLALLKHAVAFWDAHRARRAAK